MILVFHVVSQDHVFKEPCGFMRKNPFMVNNHAAKFCSYRHSGSWDIMFLAAVEEDSRCSETDVIFVNDVIQFD